MVDSIFSRDYAVVQGLTTVLCVLVSMVFPAIDPSQALLDPRISTRRRRQHRLCPTGPRACKCYTGEVGQG